MTRSKLRTTRGRPLGTAVTWGFFGLCLPLLAPGRAAAQGADASAADIAAARTLAVEGVKLAQSGKCEDAVDKLERAEKLHHAPIVLASLGECRISQGKLVEGTEMLRRVLREPLPEHPSPTLTRAYEHAQSTLDATAPKIGRLTISVNVQGEAQPAVTVDGEAVPSALLGAERPTDPGEHTIEAGGLGFLKATTKVTLADGEKRSIKLDVERDPSAVAPPIAEDAPHAADVESAPSHDQAAPSEATPSSQGASPEAPHAGPNHTAAYVSWIAGGAVLAAGAGFGIAAMSGKSDLDKQCNGNVCPPSSQEKLDAARRNGTIATIGLGVGAAGLALGTVLFFTAGSSSDSQASVTHPARRRASRRSLEASVGLGNVQLFGEF